MFFLFFIAFAIYILFYMNFLTTLLLCLCFPQYSLCCLKAHRVLQQRRDREAPQSSCLCRAKGAYPLWKEARQYFPCRFQPCYSLCPASPHTHLPQCLASTRETLTSPLCPFLVLGRLLIQSCGQCCGVGGGECACMLIHLVTSVQSCPTLCDSMDYSPPGSSVHGDAPGKNTEVDYHALLQGIFPTQGSNPGLPHCMWILYQLSYQGCYSFIPENVLVLLYYMQLSIFPNTTY